MKIILPILISLFSIISLNANVDVGAPHPNSVFQDSNITMVRWGTHFSRGITDVWTADDTLYVKVKHMCLFSLRHVLYYQIGWDSGDWNRSGLFKRNFNSVQEMLAISDSSFWPPQDDGGALYLQNDPGWRSIQNGVINTPFLAT